MNEISPLVVLAIVAWGGFSLLERHRERLPLRARRWLGDVDLEDPETVEEIKAAYVAGTITLEECERRLAVAVDPRADELRRSLEKVNGVGPSTSWSVAEKFASESDVAGAALDDLEGVSGVGPERAEAIRERLRN